MDDLLRVVAEMQPVDTDEGRARRRRRIVEAATRLMMRHGYRKTSIDDVASETGIAKGTVYLYFPSKAELLLAAIVAEKTAYLERIHPLFEPGVSPRERLRRYVVMSIELAAEMPLTSKLMHGDRELLAAMAELPPERLKQQTSLGIEFLADLLDEAAGNVLGAAGRIELAQTVSGLLMAVAMADERGRFGLSVSRFAARLADLVVDGVAAHPEVNAWTPSAVSPAAPPPSPSPPPSPPSRRSGKRPPPPASPRRPPARRRSSRAT